MVSECFCLPEENGLPGFSGDFLCIDDDLLDKVSFCIDDDDSRDAIACLCTVAAGKWPY